MTQTTAKKKLPFDLVTSGIESLSKNNEEYAAYAAKDRAITDGLVPYLKKAKSKHNSYRGYKAVAQALFESGFLSTSDSDFNTDELLKQIYGVKCVSAIPALLELHQWLMANNYNDHIGYDAPSPIYKHNGALTCFDCGSKYPISSSKTVCGNCTSKVGKKVFNTSGDNYFSAYEFDYAYTEIDKIVMKTTDDEFGKEEIDRPQAKVRVVVAECQSPMWAFVLIDSPYSGEPETLHIVQLKCNYNDPCRLDELLKMAKENTLDDNHHWSVMNNTINYGIVATVDVKSLECSTVLQPKNIESALFNIYSGHTCISMKKDA